MSDKASSLLDQKAWTAMKRIGLSEYEAKAYIALLSRRGGTASEISAASQIPISKIYDTLKSLERKGLLKAERGRPMRYIPEHPQVASESLRASIERELQSDLEVFVSSLTPIYEGGGPERPDLWIIRGEASLWRSVKDVMGRANKQLSLVLPSIPAEIQQILISTASLIKERRGVVRILLGPQAGSKTAKTLSTLAEVRVREISFGGGVINDISEAVLLLLAPGENRPQVAIYSAHLSLTAIAQAYFNILWEHSEEVKI
ncbi:MAG: helix-turn-helix domain-containing protein [Nitrososphaerota archaeon]